MQPQDELAPIVKNDQPWSKQQVRLRLPTPSQRALLLYPISVADFALFHGSMPGKTSAFGVKIYWTLGLPSQKRSKKDFYGCVLVSEGRCVLPAIPGYCGSNCLNSKNTTQYSVLVE